jgi:glutamate-1-semialdehyde aminotransferase
MPHDQLKTLLARDKILPFKRAMLNNGVDFMTGSEFVVSSEHTDKNVDDTIAAFEKAIAALRREGIV